MNQILVTEKLYITPEYRKKKSYYKIQFFLSIFLVCVLFSYYIYAEYDRNKNEEVSKDILASINFEYEEKENSITEDEIQELVINLTDNPTIITPKTQSIKNNLNATHIIVFQYIINHLYFCPFERNCIL